MNNLNIKKYCKIKYYPFFNYLKQQNIKYYFKNKTVYVVDINKKNLEFNNIQLPSKISFCFKDIIVDRRIILINYPAKYLPQNINIINDIFADLIIKNSPKLQKIPNNFKLNASLIIEDGYIKKLGKNVYIEENLSLENSRLEEIGDNLVVKGNLDISNSTVKKIGENIYIGHNFNAYQTNIKTINPTTYIGNNIGLGRNHGVIIPDNLIVNGHLHLEESNIKKMGKNIVIKGNLKLFKSDLICLPDHLTVYGDVDMPYSNIRKLGKNTIIYNDLKAQSSQLENFPNDIIINGNVFLDDTNIKKLPDNFCFNELSINRTKIKKLGKNTLIKEHLVASESELTTLSNDIIINKQIFIANSKIRELPLFLNNKINITGIVIENIDEFYPTSLSEFYTMNTPIANKTNLNFINEDKMVDVLSLISFFISKPENKKCYLESYFKNILLYNIREVYQKKLLLDKFSEITEQEIQKFIHNKNSYILLKKILKENKESSFEKSNDNIYKYEKVDLLDRVVMKGRFPMIHYCRSKQAFEFLYKNNYKFTKEELKLIPEEFNEMKNLYEMYLLKSSIEDRNKLKNLDISSTSNTTNFNKKSLNKYNVLLNNRNKI